MTKLHRKHPNAHSIIPFYASDGRLAYEVVDKPVSNGGIYFDKKWTE